MICTWRHTDSSGPVTRATIDDDLSTEPLFMPDELLFRDDPYRRDCDATVTAVEDGAIRLDRTVFYPAGGGQAGDTGVLRLGDGGVIPIVDTRKGAVTDTVLHVPADGTPAVAPGTRVTAVLDWPRRYRLMRLHTCMHLLCAVVPAPVTGGSIVPQRAHLDFDIDMARLDKAEIEARLNALIAQDHPVRVRWIDDAELAARPDLIRTMAAQPPRGSGQVRLLEVDGVDLQPCGGTHVRSTAEIGPIQVLRIRNEGRRNKRVVVGLASAGATDAVGR